MKTLYESAYDIDLFIGGVTEKPLPNAVLGPTFAQIFALQFLNSRRTDRFFYNSNVNTTYGLTQSKSQTGFFINLIVYATAAGPARKHCVSTSLN